jgi:hypothetical protein
MKPNQMKQSNLKQDMKLATTITSIAATFALPGPSIAAETIHFSPWPESRKLVHVNRVDRVSTNADWIRIEWPTESLSTPAILAAALTPIDAPAPAGDFSPSASEPAALAISTRVEPRRPTLDPRSIAKRNRPS